jgi:hypothetical protein
MPPPLLPCASPFWTVTPFNVSPGPITVWNTRSMSPPSMIVVALPDPLIVVVSS